MSHAEIWSLQKGDVAFWYKRRQFIGRIHDTCTYVHTNTRASLSAVHDSLVVPFNSRFPHILFSTISPCPSEAAEGTAVKEEEWRELHSMRGNWSSFVARYPSCHQPVLKTSTGLYLFFNHQQTPEEETSLPLTCALNKTFRKIYTPWTIKKRATLFLIITLAFLGPFLNFLYQRKQEGILYKKLIKFTTLPSQDSSVSAVIHCIA